MPQKKNQKVAEKKELLLSDVLIFNWIAEIIHRSSH